MPALLTLDWGTSNLRASLLDADGQLLQSRSAPGGVMAVPDRQFEAALRSLCGDWLERHPALPMIASGMVGSRQGWVEAPYLDCPASVADAAAQLTVVPVGAHRLHIVPGLRLLRAAGDWDVMRGEETQLWGAGLAAGSVALLPGTHCKWARMGQMGRIDSFRSHMTGELFALLTHHSILGRLMQPGQDWAPRAFEAGVRHGALHHGQLAHAVFAARTAGLMGQWAPGQLADFLSGILIGAEVAGELHDARPQGAVHLIGDDGLCERYALALSQLDVPSQRASEGATVRGQHLLAQAAGL